MNIAPAYLLMHPFCQAFYLNSYFFKCLISSSFFFKSFSNSSNFSLIKLMALFMSLGYSVPFICQSLAARYISFIIFIYVSRFCKQLNNIFTHSDDFNPCEKTPFVSNPLEMSDFFFLRFLERSFVFSWIIAAQFSLSSFKKFSDVLHCVANSKDKYWCKTRV